MSDTGTCQASGRGNPAIPFERVTVIGGGAWGTALAMTSSYAGRLTSIWIRESEVVHQIRETRRNPFLPDHPLPVEITVTDSLEIAVKGAELVLLVVPSQHLRTMARRVEALLPAGVPVLVCSKGIETDTGKLMSAVVADEMPGRPQAVLSGPSFASEVAEGQPTAVTIATDCADQALHESQNLAARCALTLTTATFRPYLSSDPVGAEVGGAVKNVLAIACGIAAGRGLGSNTRAALISRGVAEIKRLTVALGGNPETVSGLAGIGDLALTCSSEQSRNFSFGKALGQGRTPEEALAGKVAVVEGMVNALSVTALARRLGIEMPICEAVAAVIHQGVPVERAMAELLTRPLRGETRAQEHKVRVPHPVAADGRDAREEVASA